MLLWELKIITVGIKDELKNSFLECNAHTNKLVIINMFLSYKLLKVRIEVNAKYLKV